MQVQAGFLCGNRAPASRGKHLGPETSPPPRLSLLGAKTERGARLLQRPWVCPGTSRALELLCHPTSPKLLGASNGSLTPRCAAQRRACLPASRPHRQKLCCPQYQRGDRGPGSELLRPEVDGGHGPGQPRVVFVAKSLSSPAGARSPVGTACSEGTAGDPAGAGDLGVSRRHWQRPQAGSAPLAPVAPAPHSQAHSTAPPSTEGAKPWERGPPAPAPRGHEAALLLQ